MLMMFIQRITKFEHFKITLFCGLIKILMLLNNDNSLNSIVNMNWDGINNVTEKCNELMCTTIHMHITCK